MKTTITVLWRQTVNRRAGVPIKYTIASLALPSKAPTYTHVQTLAASSWVVNHNLGFYPTVQAHTNDGRVMVPGIQHVSINQTVLTFDPPWVGTVRFN